jgi:hypothetical protein
MVAPLRSLACADRRPFDNRRSIAHFNKMPDAAFPLAYQITSTLLTDHGTATARQPDRTPAGRQDGIVGVSVDDKGLASPIFYRRICASEVASGSFGWVRISALALFIALLFLRILIVALRRGLLRQHEQLTMRACGFVPK